ncbi:hypothetical protein HD554DRAFT_2036935 [Boletus coccyginus]|nr:hypothetical protein HD554DRAFT_2036935 [Boletus coccyginus]
MSSIPDGDYFIRIPDPEQSIEASANNRNNCAVKPVIIDGQMKVWSVRGQRDGNYRLVLEETWYSSNEGKEVVVKTSVDPGTRWKIVPVEDHPDLYTIQSTDGDTAWTATHQGVRKVMLIPVIYSPDQLWNFILVPRD